MNWPHIARVTEEMLEQANLVDASYFQTPPTRYSGESRNDELSERGKDLPQ